MTAERRLHDDEGDFPSQIGVLGRRAGGADRADPIFQPNSGKVNRSYQSRELPDRFSQQLRRFEFDEPSQRNSWCGSPA